MKVGLFSLGSLSLVILLDSPAFSLKLTTISTSAFYEDNVPGNSDNIFPWDALKRNLTPKEGGYPERIPFKWFITARNDNNFDVILKKVSFQLFQTVVLHSSNSERLGARSI